MMPGHVGVENRGRLTRALTWSSSGVQTPTRRSHHGPRGGATAPQHASAWSSAARRQAMRRGADVGEECTRRTARRATNAGEERACWAARRATPSRAEVLDGRRAIEVVAWVREIGVCVYGWGQEEEIGEERKWEKEKKKERRTLWSFCPFCLTEEAILLTVHQNSSALASSVKLLFDPKLKSWFINKAELYQTGHNAVGCLNATCLASYTYRAKGMFWYGYEETWGAFGAKLARCRPF